MKKHYHSVADSYTSNYGNRHRNKHVDEINLSFVELNSTLNFTCTDDTKV